MIRCITATALILALTSACGPAVDSPGAGEMTGRIFDEARRSADLVKAVEFLEQGECGRVVGFLSVYASDGALPGAVDYLMAHAHLCQGELLKAAHHAAKSWEVAGSFRDDVAVLVERIMKRLSSGGAGAGGDAGQAAWLLARLRAVDMKDATLATLVGNYSVRLAARGDFTGALAGVEAMRWFGAGLGQTLMLETEVYARLGKPDELYKSVDGGVAGLGKDAGKALYEAAVLAESLFRADISLWLLLKAQANGCGLSTLNLDLARARLQQGDVNGAVSDLEAHIAHQKSGSASRSLESAALLVRFSKLAEARALLQAAFERQPQEFPLAVELANLIGSGAPGELVKVFSRHIDAVGGSSAAFVRVGDHLVDARLCDVLVEMAASGGEAGLEAWQLLYKGACELFKNRESQAQGLFRQAVEKASEPLEIYSRVAEYYLRSGRLDTGIGWLEKAMKDRPGDAGLLVLLAELKEQKKAGEGVSFLGRQVKSLRPTGDGALVLARWLVKKSSYDIAVRLARTAAETAATASRWEAWGIVARGLLAEERVGEACDALTRMLDLAPDAVAATNRLLALTDGHKNPRVACLRAESVERLGPPDALPPDVMAAGTISGMVCGRPNPEFLKQYLMMAGQGLAVTLLLDVALEKESVGTLIKTVDGLSARLDLGPDAWGRLALMASQKGWNDMVGGFVARYLAAPPASSLAMEELALSLALYGARPEAVRVLGVAFQRSSGDEREQVGTSYAALLLSQGKMDEGFGIIKETVDGAKYRATTAVKLATLLLEANQPGQARQIAIGALKDPGSVATITGSLRDKVKENAAGAKEEALAKLLDQITLDIGTGKPPAESLIKLAAFASWAEKSAPEALAADLEPYLDTPALRRSLAVAMLRLGWAEAALGVLAKAMEQTPSDPTLLYLSVCALMVDGQLRGELMSSLTEKVRALVQRTIQARENSAVFQRNVGLWLWGYGINGLAAELIAGSRAGARLEGKELVKYGTLLTALGRQQEGLGAYKEALELSSCDGDVMDEMASSLTKVGLFDELHKLLGPCCERYPRSTVRWWVLASSLLEEGRTDMSAERRQAAMEAIDVVVKAKPDVIPLVIEKLAQADFITESAELARFAIEKGSPQAVVDVLRAAFGAMAEEVPRNELESLAEVAAKRRSGSSADLLSIASLLFDYGVWAAGLEVLRKAAESNEPSTLGLLGLREMAIGQKESGIKRIHSWLESEFTRANPDGDGRVPATVQNLLYLLHDFLLDSGDAKLAQELIGKAVGIYPNDPRARITLLSHLIGGKPEPFFDAWAGLALSPRPEGDDLGGFQSLLSRMRRLGWLDRGCQILKSKWEESRSTALLPYLVHAYASAGDTSSLLQLVDEALRAAPADYPLLKELGLLLVERDLGSVAEPVLLQALRYAPMDPDLLGPVHRALCRAYSAMGVRERINDVHRVLLLQQPENWELRFALVRNLVEFHYFAEAERQLRFLTLNRDNPAEHFMLLSRLASLQGNADESWRLSLIGVYGMPDSDFRQVYRFAAGNRENLLFEQAFGMMERLWDSLGNWTMLPPLLAEYAVWAGRDEMAFKRMEEFVAAQPSRSNLLTAMGVMIDFQYFGRAQALVNKHPKNADLKYRLAAAMFLSGMKDEAEQLVRQALEISTIDAEIFVHYLRTRVHMVPLDVLKLVHKSYCAASGARNICLALEANIALADGAFDRAMELFLEAGRGTRYSWSYALEGISGFLRQGRPEEAGKLLEKARFGMRSRDVNLNLFGWLTDFVHDPGTDAKAARDAVALYRAFQAPLLKREPDDFWLRSQEAESYALLGQFDEVKSTYEQLLKDIPWESGPNNNLAYFLANRGLELDRGIELVKNAMRLDASSNVFYLDTLGWLLFKKGDHKQAHELIARSLHYSSAAFGRNLAEVYWHLAEVSLALGKKDQAIKMLWFASYRDPFAEYGTKARAKLKELGQDPYRR